MPINISNIKQDLLILEQKKAAASCAVSQCIGAINILTQQLDLLESEEKENGKINCEKESESA